MPRIRHVIIVLGMLVSSVASAQISIGIGLPHVSIGINLPVYPRLVRVPDYPVYYAPQLEANFFFYDGMYWVYQNDEWYASSWYNGPWWLMNPQDVPVFILRIPVRYYRRPPAYFHGWQPDAPPRWGDHWGRDWEQHRSGWDNWDRRAAPAPAPLPTYQRQYSGDRYPRQVEQQHELQQQKYRYQPRDPVVRQEYQERYQGRAAQRAPARQVAPQQEKQGAPEQRGFRQQDNQRSAPRQQEGPAVLPAQRPQRGPAQQVPQQERQSAPERARPQDVQRPMPREQERPAAPRSSTPQRGGEGVQRPTASPQPGRPNQEQRQPPQPRSEQRRQQTPESQRQGRGATREQRPGRAQQQEQTPEKARGRDRND